jgi:hypothetical protein
VERDKEMIGKGTNWNIGKAFGQIKGNFESKSAINNDATV